MSLSAPLKPGRHCGYCTVKMGAPPVPVVVNQNEETGQWVVKQWACSLDCAVGWHVHTVGDDIGLMFQTLWARDSGLMSASEVAPCSLPRELLEVFGGEMTREEWAAGRGSLASPGVMTDYVEAPRGRMGTRIPAVEAAAAPEKEKPPAPRKRQKRTNVADYFAHQ